MNDLLYAPGADNLAGIVGEIYICPTSEIANLPVLAAATSLKTTVANMTCVATKKFSRLYFTDETGKVETKLVGERDGRASETILTCRYPKFGTELIDFMRSIQNTPSVIIFRMAHNGKLYLMGITQLDISSTTLSKDIPAYYESGESTTGEKRADQNGALLSWKYTSAHGPVEYAGTIPLVAA